MVCHGAPPLSVAAAPQPMAVTAPAISLPEGCSRPSQHDGAAAGTCPGPLGPESTLPPSLSRPGCSSGVAPTQRHRVSKMAQGPGTKKCAPAPRPPPSKKLRGRGGPGEGRRHPPGEIQNSNSMGGPPQTDHNRATCHLLGHIWAASPALINLFISQLIYLLITFFRL